MTEKILINKIKRATDLISDVADYYERNHLKIESFSKEFSSALNNLAEMYNILDEVISTTYKSDTEVLWTNTHIKH